MSKVTKTLFGDSGEKAAKEQAKNNAQTERFLAEQAEKARDDLLTLLPFQHGTRQEGSIAAQQQLAATLPQVQNALMGRGVDFSVLQPQQPAEATFSDIAALLSGKKPPGAAQ